MIYCCPHCKTDLEIQESHLGIEVTCPECEKAFELPEKFPVVVHKASPYDVYFIKIFLTVVYTFISILLVLTLCVACYFGVKHFYPSIAIDFGTKTEKTAAEKELRFVDPIPVEREFRGASARSARDNDDSEDAILRKRNAEAEKAFFKELENLEKKKK